MPASRSRATTRLRAAGSPPLQIISNRSLCSDSVSGTPRNSSGTKATPQTEHESWAEAYSASHDGQYFRTFVGGAEIASSGAGSTIRIALHVGQIAKHAEHCDEHW